MDISTISLFVIFAIVFIIGIAVAFWIGKKIGELRKQRELDRQVLDIRSDAINKSRAVLGGQFSEQLSPYLPNFKYNPCDCKFIGKPVDFIVFKGMNEKEISEIVFLEVKSGDSKLNSNQKYLKDAVQNGRVYWDEYRVDRGLTGKRD